LRQQEGRYPIHACQQLIDEGFRYFQTVIVTAVVYWSLYQKLWTFSIHFTAPDKGQIIYFIIKILHNPVFLINSRHPQFCAIRIIFQINDYINLTLFIPKIQSYLAEFLKHHSLKHLSILCQITCDGYKYGLIFYKLFSIQLYINNYNLINNYFI